MSDSYGKVIPFRKRGEKAPETSSSTEPTFKEFAEAIMTGNETEASRVLSILFAVDKTLSEKCVKHYLQEFKKDDAIFMKTMQIRTYLESNQMNDLIGLLIQLFGVSGPESIVIIDGLSKRFLVKKA